VLNLIKNFFKIEFKNDNFLFGMVEKVEVFKGPCQTVLNGSILYETILVFVNQRSDYCLQSVSQKLGNELNRAVQK
jgi:hypothetical protein